MKIICCVLSLISLPSIAQTVSNVTASLAEEKVTIKYDLVGNSSSEKYNVKCFYSTNNGQTYAHELITASGAVGTGQTSGNGKTIIWDVKKDLVDYDGNLKFKVHASVPENYFVGTSISVQLLKLIKTDDKALALKGYFFGKGKNRMAIQLSSVITDTGGRSYKLVGGKIDNQQMLNPFEIVEGDTHFFELLFAPLNGESLTNSPIMNLAFFVFDSEKISMQGLNIKASK